MGVNQDELIVKKIKKVGGGGGPVGGGWFTVDVNQELNVL